jgi:hypothetical protein
MSLRLVGNKKHEDDPAHLYAGSEGSLHLSLVESVPVKKMVSLPCHMALIVGIASGTVRLMRVASVESASSGFHCVITRAWPGYVGLYQTTILHVVFASTYRFYLGDDLARETQWMDGSDRNSAHSNTSRCTEMLESFELLGRVRLV